MSHSPAPTRYDRPAFFRRSGRSGLKLPAISLGLWHNFGAVEDFANSRALVLKAFDLGITHFDLANNYGPPPGSAEANFGRIMATDLEPYRDEMIISTKAGYLMWPGPYGEWGSRKYLLASLDQSLQRMGLEYVDIFYSHRFDPNTPLEEMIFRLMNHTRRAEIAENLCGAGRLFGIVIGERCIERLARAHRVGERAHRFLEGRFGVRAVGVENVHVVEAQPLKALVQ